MAGRAFRALAGTIGIALLAACGGGGGGAAPTTTFALATAYKNRIAAGYSITFSVSQIGGTCSGSATQVSGAPAPATFEGVSGFAATVSHTLTLANCGSTGTVATSGSATSYYDAAFGALGSTSGGQVGVYQPSPAAPPDQVQVGAQGSIGVETVYTDSSKTTVASSVHYSYAVSADTATSAAVVLTATGYDGSGNLVFTEQDHYRIGADGTLTLVFEDIVYAGGLHLAYTPT